MVRKIVYYTLYKLPSLTYFNLMFLFEVYYFEDLRCIGKIFSLILKGKQTFLNVLRY